MVKDIFLRGDRNYLNTVEVNQVLDVDMIINTYKLEKTMDGNVSLTMK